MILSKGLANKYLTKSEIYSICNKAFSIKKITNKKVLVIIPDNSRTAPIDIMFRIIYELLSDCVKQLDFIIALGTHPPLNDEAINKRVGITQEERITKFQKARFFNHNWKNSNQLQQIGTISEKEIAEISNGLLQQKVDVTINKMVFDYDLLMIIGPTFPHEVVGFSGGNKYLFPGISGQEIIDVFHWLGALITNSMINGVKDTPVRKIINKAASFLPIERLCLSLVVKENNLAGLFIGSPESAFTAAADLSNKVHIIYKDQPFKRVLSCASDMYDDIWTAGKCMYKLEPVVADGGELIIYAPHITEVSVTHKAIIEKIGYHIRDYFLKKMNKYNDIPRGVMAHSTHVKGNGIFKNGIEYPRINVTLATQIPENMCKKINLGYRDLASINIEDWMNKENEGILYIPKAGEILYRLKSNTEKEV